jgi:hypothetical protein
MALGLAACGARPGTETAGTEPAATETAATPPPAVPLTSVDWREDFDYTFFADTDKFADPGTFAVSAEDFTFMRIHLGADFLANELTEARLFLKPAGEKTPDTLRLALISAFWDGYFMTRDEAKGLIMDGSEAALDVTAEADGFISVDVTDFVKKWIGGKVQNNGFAIFADGGEPYSFVSIMGAEEDAPGIAYIRASGETGVRPPTYGKFGYTQTPLPDGENMGGNCLSYALRDVNMILGGDVGEDRLYMATLYQNAKNGVDELAGYTANLITEYVNAHKEGLQILRFRRIDDFDSSIDPATEYRVAFRFGVSLLDEENPDFTDDHSYDWHWWAQLNDGRWAQKFPTGPSEIVPCTGPGISPGAFPWDSGYNRSSRTADFYTSKVMYFAVTKDTGEMTAHRGETRDREMG